MFSPYLLTSTRSKWVSLSVINLAHSVPPLDTGIMALILPTISISLKAPVDVVIWVPLVSLLVEAAFMPSFGNYSDRNGRKRYFILGLLLFAVGSFLAGNSQTIFELLIYRVIQSFGSAFILANGRALIVDTFGPEQRGFALGTHVSSIYVAMTIGTAITGSIVSVTQLIGWRYVFYVSGGIALASIPLAFIFLRESRKNPEAKQDWPGALLFAAAITSSLVTIAGRANSVGSIDIYVEYIRIPVLNLYFYTNSLVSIPLLAFAIAAVASFAVFVLRELTTGHPMIDFRLFKKNSLFLSTNLAALFLYVSVYSVLIMLSFYLEVIKGIDPLTSGLLLTVQPLSVTVFATLGGWISDRTRSRDSGIAGLGVTVVALLLLSTISTSSDVLYVAFLLAMLGAGVGLFAPNNTNANLSSVPPRMRALANGILGMMRHTGQSLSLALSTALLGLYLFGQSPQLGGTFDPAKYISALQVNFVVGAAVASLGILVSLRSRKQDAWESDHAPSGSSLSDDV
ncbi:MAG: MFS transporter [Thaumarchaeota archaeon]|nr:MAG: MFS transporter [Nitrososphaerota archaeon]